ncbi:MAG: Smr/MutS family protein, partial [Chloroflexota bacterium]|nr:Smr/MutS family protein [Chloroflexota bacterium]
IAVATTHFSELKMFAHTTPGLRNASLDFDPVTLMPTYHLTMGVPGGSNALAIATQLGLPPEIITAAREMLSKGSADVEIMLADLTSEKQRIENLRSVLEKDTDEAQRLRSQLEHELQTLREQKETMLRHERDKLADEAAELHREAQHAASELKKKRSQENLEQAERALATMRERITELSSSIKASHSSVTGEPGEASHIKVGDKVWLTDINTWGTVLSIREDEGQIEVQVGHTRLSMGLHDAEKIKPPPGKVLPKPPAVKQTVTRATSLELDLRGRRADEVVLKLDRYLNEASLARFSRVRIIHGFGTGTVRQIVRDMLASHPLVKSFRSGEQGEGGDGVTMVNL